MIRLTGIILSRSHMTGNFFRRQSTVGFIGLGNMGAHMARNLLKKGHSLTVYDQAPGAMTSLAESGAVPCRSAGELASLCDTVITMLPNSQHVTQVYSSAGGLLQNAKKGALMIDCSTIDPLVTRQTSGEARQRGCVFVDAPVSGGVNAARDGTLTFMVGAETEDEFCSAERLLAAMGGKVVHCGAVSSGQAAKICNNMLLAISMVGTAEAMSLGIKLGLKPQVLAQIISSSSGRCWSADTYNPVPGVMTGVPSSNNYQGGFGTALMCKDLGLAQSAATSVDACTPLGGAALHLYRQMVAAGMGQLDFSSVYRLVSGADSS